MTEIEDFEAKNLAESEIRWMFDEYGIEVKFDIAVNVQNRTTIYTIETIDHRYIFRTCVPMINGYNALNRIWECYDSYILLDCDKLKKLIKLITK